MRRHESGTALTGPISGKLDIGDAVPAGKGPNASLALGRPGARANKFTRFAQTQTAMEGALARISHTNRRIGATNP